MAFGRVLSHASEFLRTEWNDSALKLWQFTALPTSFVGCGLDIDALSPHGARL
jgi:hypothetical protein